jgi:hypothetical protein
MIDNETLRKLKNDLHQYVEGDVVADLGAGAHITRMADFLFDAGASEYIYVDKYHYDKFAHYSMKKWESAGRNFDRKIGKEGDMLRFLSQQQDNSMSVVLFGIDRIIIRDTPEGNRYVEFLVGEIKRVAGTDHIVFGFSSTDISDKLAESGFEIVSSYDIKGGRPKRGIEILKQRS